MTLGELAAVAFFVTWWGGWAFLIWDYWHDHRRGIR